jgi:hypothetical protein
MAWWRYALMDDKNCVRQDRLEEHATKSDCDNFNTDFTAVCFRDDEWLQC